MPNWAGFFPSPTSSPAIRISVSGPIRTLRRDFDAIIDTGFTGFLCMPQSKAFSVGLRPASSTTIVLADGSTSARLTAVGEVTVGTESDVGVIILEPGSDDLLLGMKFLAKFKKTLRVSPGTQTVDLVDDPSPPAAPPASPAPTASRP